MAFDNGKKNTDINSNSRLRFGDNTVKEKALAIKYWKDQMQLVIHAWTGTEYKELGKVNLSPTKAKVLEHVTREFMTDPTCGTSRAVITGIGDPKGCVYVKDSDGLPCVVISSINAAGDEVSHEEVVMRPEEYIQFKGDNYKSFTKHSENYVGLEVLVNALDAFSRAAGGATAHFVNDSYHTRQTSQNIYSIMQKVGVETKGGNYSRNSSSYFDGGSESSGDDYSGGSKSYGNSSSYEDLESMMED